MEHLGLNILTLPVMVLILALYFGYIWVLWAAAMEIPPPTRMRQPWMIWLFAAAVAMSVFLGPNPLVLLPNALRLPTEVGMPILYMIVPFFILLPLTMSYGRFFSEHKVPSHGGYGFRTAMACCTTNVVSILHSLLKPLPIFMHTWPHFSIGLNVVLNIVDMARSLAILALVIIMWRLRGQARKIIAYIEHGGAPQEAVTWLETQLPPTEDTPPNPTRPASH